MTPADALPGTPNPRYDARPGALLIAATAEGGRLGGEALRMAGIRIVRQSGWDEMMLHLDDRASLDLVVMDAVGAEPDAFAPAIDAVERHAAANGATLVAIIDESLIDDAAQLIGGPHHLLCSPSIIERVATLAAAASATGVHMFNDSSPEGESARLQRLNIEIARIAEALARLTRSDPANEPPSALADRSRGFAGPGMADDVAVSAQDVRQIIRARRLRDQIVAPGLFEDPAWDMLLDLFAAELEGVRVSVSSLCIAAMVAPTTALRWIGRMTNAGLFERHDDPFDRRRAYMTLSASARDSMNRYWASVKRGGPTLV